MIEKTVEVNNMNIDEDELYDDDPFFTWITLIGFGIYYYVIMVNISDAARFFSSQLQSVTHDECVNFILVSALVIHFLIYCFLRKTFK